MKIVKKIFTTPIKWNFLHISTPGACTVTLFTVVISPLSQKARAFVNGSHFHSRVIFARKAGVYLSRATHRILALPVNIRQGWKWLAITNALAYNDTILFTAVKSLTVQAPTRILGLNLEEVNKLCGIY
jgi:hypothetical protein